MITPKQSKLLEKLQRQIPEIFSRLDLQVVESPEFKRNCLIQDRVDACLKDISPQLPPRSIPKSGIRAEPCSTTVSNILSQINSRFNLYLPVILLMSLVYHAAPPGKPAPPHSVFGQSEFSLPACHFGSKIFLEHNAVLNHIQGTKPILLPGINSQCDSMNGIMGNSLSIG